MLCWTQGIVTEGQYLALYQRESRSTLSHWYEHLRFDLLSPLNIEYSWDQETNAAEKQGRAEDDMAQNVVVKSTQPQMVAKSWSHLSLFDLVCHVSSTDCLLTRMSKSMMLAVRSLSGNSLRHQMVFQRWRASVCNNKRARTRAWKILRTPSTTNVQCML